MLLEFLGDFLPGTQSWKRQMWVRSQRGLVSQEYGRVHCSAWARASEGLFNDSYLLQC